MWNITKTDKGYEWSCFNSAYGAAGGVEPTLARAKVALVIGQADMFDRPFPKSVIKMMMDNAEEIAKEYPDPVAL